MTFHQTGQPCRLERLSAGPIAVLARAETAKTGSTWVQSGASRRLVFGFTGWSEPTMPGGCGRALVIPRDLAVVGSELHVLPIPETAVLRTTAFPTTIHSIIGTGTTIARGSTVEIRLNCSQPDGGWPNAGKLGLRTLMTIDGTSYTEIGYNG